MKKSDLEQLKAAIAELPNNAIAIWGKRHPDYPHLIGQTLGLEGKQIHVTIFKSLIAHLDRVTDQRDRLVEHMKLEPDDCDFARIIVAEIAVEEGE